MANGHTAGPTVVNVYPQQAGSMTGIAAGLATPETHQAAPSPSAAMASTTPDEAPTTPAASATATVDLPGKRTQHGPTTNDSAFALHPRAAPRPEPPVELQRRFLDLAEAHQWAGLVELLQSSPELVNAAPLRRGPALCEAAEAGNAEVVRDLLLARAAPNQQSHDGKFPWQLAPEGSHARRILESSWICGPAEDAMPRTFKTGFVRAYTNSALIGSKYERSAYSPGVGQRVVSGLQAQYESLRKDRELLLWDRGPHGAEHMRSIGMELKDLEEGTKRAMMSLDEGEFRQGVVQAYFEASWLRPVLSAAFRELDESKCALKAYARALHDTIADAPAPFEKREVKSWRWVSLRTEALEKYQYHETAAHKNLLSFAGFTHTSADARATIRSMLICEAREADQQVLMIIHPGTAWPMCIGTVSGSLEALFPLGQVFRLCCPRRWWTPTELGCELGVPDGDLFASGREVIELEAISDSDAFCVLADDLFVDGGASKAVLLLSEKLRLDVQRHGERSFEVARGHRELGKALRVAGDFSGALQSYEAAMELCVARGDKLSMAAISHNMAEIHQELGQFVEALRCYGEAWPLRQECLGAEHPDFAATLTGMASAKAAIGEPREALELHEQALGICRKAFGEEHAMVAVALSNMANMHRELGEPRKELELHAESLRIKRGALGEEHPDVATSLDDVAMAHRALGELGKARELHDKARSMRRKALGDQYRDTGHIWCKMSRLSLDEKRHDLAAQQIDAARRCYAAGLCLEHPATLEAEEGPQPAQTSAEPDSLG